MMIRMAATRLSMALLGAWLWLGAAAFAQDAGSKEAAETADKLQALSGQERTDLIARLDDAQVRDLLLFYLGKTAAGSSHGSEPGRGARRRRAERRADPQECVAPSWRA